jgi:hypothetical protein
MICDCTGQIWRINGEKIWEGGPATSDACVNRYRDRRFHGRINFGPRYHIVRAGSRLSGRDSDLTTSYTAALSSTMRQGEPIQARWPGYEASVLGLPFTPSTL